MEAILKSGNSGKELVCNSVFLLRLYLTDLASERLAFGKGMILLPLIDHYLYMLLFSWFERPYLMCFMLSSLQRNPGAV